MDASTLGQYSGYVALLISMGAMIIGVVNHKRIRSNCCGREGSVSLDIGPASSPRRPSPPASKPNIVI